MNIAPIRRSVQVRAAPPRAFELFTGHMQDWWPKGGTIARNPHVLIVIEPHADGKWFERDAEGNETHWGKVLAWEPPERVLLAWQINSQWAYDPDFETEVEITFQPADGGGTVVTLEHRNMERFGPDAARHAAMLDSGWPTHLGHFATWADTQS
jgi:uncharacterized protein YndB with AHSA1/START domain